MKTKPLALLALISAFSLQPSALLFASPLGTAFSYQGKLADGASAANGSYDLKFTLYDALSSGSLVAGPLTNSPVAVTNGLFTVSLDFGGSVFDGNARWLEIAVRSNGSGAFTTLAPRQTLTPSPYAVYAPTAGTANTASSVAAASISGTVALGQLPGSVVTNGASGVNLSGTFSGNGAGLSSVPGTLPWQTVAGTTQTAAPNTGYVLTNAAQTIVTLPATASVGDLVRVSGVGAGGWAVEWPWIVHESDRSWRCVASSADGTRLVAGAYGGDIHTSTDSGATWTPRQEGMWCALASSADGTKLVAGEMGGAARILTSTDSGLTWTPRASGQDWQCVASSADGTKLVAAVYSGRIYTSIDSGTNWTATSAPGTNWTSVASSADGTKLVAGVYIGRIYTSIDSGVTWTPRETGRAWRCVASSADGTKLVAAVYSGRIYTSTDSGVTWTPRETGRAWRCVASSADGAKLAAADYGGRIYTSTDSGVTWAAHETTRNWGSVASSADGSKLVAVVDGGRIYTSTLGWLIGAQGTTAALQYLGNGQWQALNESRIAAGAVGSAQLSSGAVTAAALADGAVTAAKVATASNWFALTIANPTPADSDYFGRLVAAAGSDRMLIGASYDDTGGVNAGAAYLFSANGTLLTTFTNPTPVGGDFFGSSLAAVGSDRVLIGAPYDDTGAVDAGTAYLFNTDGTLLTTFTNPTPADSDYFGYAVAAVGSDRVLIGTPYDDTGAVNAGAAYLFSTDGTLLTTFTNPTPAGADYFGSSVAGLGSDRVLIGAYWDDSGAADAGAAYLFSTNGTLLTTFTNPTPAAGDWFGSSLAAVGSDRVLIGAYLDDTGAADAGAAYLFSTNGTLLTTFTNPTPAASDNFGRSVAAAGSDRVLIGAYRDDTGAADAGAAYLFSTDGTLLMTFTNPTPAGNDSFGFSVAGLGSDRVLIGALGKDMGAAYAGAAYLFSVESYNPGLIADGVRPGAITTDSLADGSITSSKIADSAVSSTQLANNAVTSAKIAPGAVTSESLADTARLPAGMLSPYAGTNAPPGWLLCYGQAVSRTNFTALFAAIGTAYGVGNGSTTFNVPDLRGRSAFGKHNMGGTVVGRITTDGSAVDGTLLGAAGGSETVTLNVNQLTAHSHPVNDPGHTHSYQDPGHGHTYNWIGYLAPFLARGGDFGRIDFVTEPGYVGISILTNTTGMSVNSAGGGGAHNNLPPAMIMNYIIKY
jgi:microcystin-dependent protein